MTQFQDHSATNLLFAPNRKEKKKEYREKDPVINKLIVDTTFPQ